MRLRSNSAAWPLAIVAIGLIGFLTSALMSWQRMPAPEWHDEFSNLLLADTLLHGRLANDAPEVWQPLQSFHVLVQPTYSSKYPLGSGLLIALGWLLFGTPAAGLWLGAGLCSASMTWALGGCFTKRWACIAGLLVALHPELHQQWSTAYVNGWLASIAGALVAGAAMRVRHHITARNAMVLGCGVGLLALTRPFEGLIFCLTTAVLLLFWWRAESWQSQLRKAFKLSIISAGPIAMAFVAIVAHNLATTGKWYQLPYQLHETTYGVAPLNVFQSPRVPTMAEWQEDVPPSFKEFHYGWSMKSYALRSNFAGLVAAITDGHFVIARFWGYAFCFAIALAIISTNRIYWPFAITVGVALWTSALVPWFYPHYFAPSLVWLVALTVIALRSTLLRFTNDQTKHRIALRSLVAMQALLMVIQLISVGTSPFTWGDKRQELDRTLSQAGGKHLILVRYHEQHNCHAEWVYNGADLKNTAVLWAHSWRGDLDEKLRLTYPDRHVWLLEFDERDHSTLTELSRTPVRSLPETRPFQPVSASSAHWDTIH